jgi:iron complex transport system substrate-binding protein
MSVIAVATMALASACSGDDPQAATTVLSTSASTPTTTAGGGSSAGAVFDETDLGLAGFPELTQPAPLFDVVGRTDSTITVEHAYGEIEIPRNPQRIVVSYESAEALISLGFDPIAYPSFIDMPPTLRAQSPDTEWLQITDVSPNLERLAALEPDLIIEAEPWAGGIGERSNYETVSRIAPTLVLKEFPTYWMSALRQFGELFDRSDQAEQVIADYTERVSELRERARNVISDDTVATVLFFGLEPYLYVPASTDENGRAIPAAPVSWLYQELDLEASSDVVEAFAEDPTTGYVLVSPEFMPDLEAEHLVVLPGGYSGESEIDVGYDSFVDSAIWRAIPAVANGNVHELKNVIVPFGFFTKLDIMEKFVDAIER